MPFLKLASLKRKLSQGENDISIFESVRGRSAFLLHGAEGRYSFIGYDPFAKIWSRKGVTQLEKLKDFYDWKKSDSIQMFEGDPIGVLRKLSAHFRYNGKSPVPFCGGLAGYFSYDFGASMGGVRQKVFDDLELPDFVFCFVNKLLAIDHELSELHLLALAPTDARAEYVLKSMEADLEGTSDLIAAGDIGEIQSNLSFEKYSLKLAKIRHYLEEGETYQVNFSQRFSASSTRDPWSVYKSLDKINPADYGCFFDFEDFQIVSSSPELLLKKNGSSIVTKPIKGTVAKGKNNREDEENIEVLRRSKKDAAELAMIVDLERNDIGKVCEPGTVRVKSHREVKKLARVIHTLSTVEGKLHHNRDFLDAFEALFPGGSITGCPKKRTMEIIDELEDFRRGIYTGSAGYLGFDGNGEMNILIRTLLVKDGRLYFQAGGGIVIDSDAGKEYEESFRKALAINEALGKS